MRGEIERPAIRFDLYNSAGRDALGGAMDQDFADAFARNEQDWTGVKFARQLPRLTHRDAYCNWGKQGNSGVTV
jgi:hypothetical protein